MYDDNSYGSYYGAAPANPTSPLHGLRGSGGLQYQVDSPPGVGRQVLVPFELLAGNLPVAAGVVAAGTRFMPLLAGEAVNQLQMVSANIPWAVVRIVGVITSTTRQGTVTDQIEVIGLQVGGGANLLLAQTGGRVEAFDIANEHLAGLRDYPLLRSPNQAFLTLGFRDGTAIAAALLGNNLVTAALVCEVLADDNFGAHIPGPYARGQALTRQQIGRR